MNFPGLRKKPLLREIGKNAVLFLMSLVFALGIVEVAFRFYNPLGFRIKGNKIILPVNRTQIIHNKKNGRLDELVVNRKNSLGFRGEDPPGDFSDWLTIITVGGSTTECLALNEDKSWPQLLGGKLKNHFPKSWLNNAGFGGHSTFGHAILMQDFLIKMKPKLVLLLVGTNEVGRSDLSIQDHNLAGIGFRRLEGALITAANHSEVASALLNLYRFYFPVVTTNLGDIGEIDLRSLKNMEIPITKEEAIIANHRRNYLPYYRQRLEKLVNLARENQIDPVLITQPVLYGEVVDEITGVDLGKIDIWGATNGKVGWEVMELYNDITRQVGETRGLLVIDLARELPKSSRYFYDLSHYSNEGASRVGEIIYAHLCPYLAKKYPDHYQAMSPTRH